MILQGLSSLVDHLPHLRFLRLCSLLCICLELLDGPHAVTRQGLYRSALLLVQYTLRSSKLGIGLVLPLDLMESKANAGPLEIKSHCMPPQKHISQDPKISVTFISSLIKLEVPVRTSETGRVLKASIMLFLVALRRRKLLFAAILVHEPALLLCNRAVGCSCDFSNATFAVAQVLIHLFFHCYACSCCRLSKIFHQCGHEVRTMFPLVLFIDLFPCFFHCLLYTAQN
mmetsp:Transcript_28547/g.51683  ORF Transcript_28547/g.51683 Transcript_28547/m.51683 type:complete len:228 (+) Transcript_28547:388-1071(+)